MHRVCTSSGEASWRRQGCWRETQDHEKELVLRTGEREREGCAGWRGQNVHRHRGVKRTADLEERRLECR